MTPKSRAKTSRPKFNPKVDYPLSQNRPDLVRTLSGKSLNSVTLEGVVSKKIDSQEFRIRPETLRMQAKVAAAHGREQLALNLRRAAELTAMPDDYIFKVYNALRPRRSTEEELLALAKELDKTYEARLNAELVREAARIYKIRHLLKES